MTAKHVFLVDDDLDTLTILALRIRKFLKPWMELITATRGTEALNLMKQKAEPGDVLITDHGLPDVSGLQVADEAPKGVKCHVFSNHTPLSQRAQHEVVSIDDVDDLLPVWLSEAA